ncbi:pyridoxine/pyridoxamine 5'-phosphate oxidase [Aestuariivivens sediminis]|uniref:pyridoxine/pyridoxamine 5'-phosphate oxidase n=1 Tax=Aestuariivivens sediminis TaxID=2913557 RepID=UPI001F59D62D|nr:pyridoxal 5'-phosphate synthase [Aestuariivivens sediminis]
MKNPIDIFNKWFFEEEKLTSVTIPTAVCLSTNGLDGFPNARVVSYKEISENNFIITGPLNSRKGMEIERSNKVALTFWWAETERQVRIQGLASKLSEELADKIFRSRDLNSQIVSSICKQGTEIDELQNLEAKILKRISKKTCVSRPKEWGGYSIKPLRIEFMEFKKNRFHIRSLFELENGSWIIKQIQP